MKIQSYLLPAISADLERGQLEGQSISFLAFVSENCKDALAFHKIRFKEPPQEITAVLGQDDCDLLGLAVGEFRAYFEGVPLIVKCRATDRESHIRAEGEQVRSIYFCGPAAIFLTN